jgi:hypothetical protein
MAEYTNPEDYHDEQEVGFDDNGRRISHQERYEFMIGYLDDTPILTGFRGGNLERMLLASRFS